MGGWTKWQNLGGVILSAPSVASRGTGKMTVVARGPDNQLTYRYYNQDTGWNNAWQPLGGEAMYDPVIVSDDPDRYTVFRVGPQQRIWRRSFSSSAYDQDDNGWGNWEQVAGVNTAWSGLAAASPQPGQIELFTQDQRNESLWITVPTGGDAQITSLGGTFNGTPAATARSGSGRVDLLARDATSNMLHHRALTGEEWTSWTALEGPVLSGPAVASPSNDRLEVFAKGDGHEICSRSYKNGSWSRWETGEVAGTDDNLAAASPHTGAVHQFIRGRDNHLYVRTYSDTTG
jgi:hypothetical protein